MTSMDELRLDILPFGQTFDASEAIAYIFHNSRFLKILHGTG